MKTLLKNDIDIQTRKYKTCPCCGEQLFWTLDFKYCACSDPNCEFNDTDGMDYYSKVLLNRF